jgi:hypothetical protein
MAMLGDDPAWRRQHAIDAATQAIRHYDSSGLAALAEHGGPVYYPAIEMACSITILITELEKAPPTPPALPAPPRQLPPDTGHGTTVTMTESWDPEAWRPRFPRRGGGR